MKTFLKAFSTKLTLVVLALASMATSAMAEVKLSFDDIALFVGKSTPVTVLMDNDEDNITNLQFDITLPENVTLDVASVKAGPRFSSKQALSPVVKQNDGSYRFVITSTTKDGFSGNEGELLTFNITAQEPPLADDALTFSNIVAVVDVEKLTTSGTPGPILTLADGVTVVADIDEITLENGKGQIGVSMNNSMDLVSMQGLIELPAGLTLDADEPITGTDRVAGLTIDYNANTGKFLLSSTSNTPITGNYGTVFYLNLVADNTLVASSQVTIQNFVVSTPRAQAFRPDQILTVMVTNDIAPEPIYLETDVTSQFSALTQASNWTTGAGGTAGYTATNFCPAVTTNAGQTVQVCEFYEQNCNREGDILYQTVTGLAPGVYQIELYGAAAYTFGRGFDSDAFSSGTWNAGDHIDENTGVVLYAETSEDTYGGEIPIYYATDFPDGAAVVSLNNVVVGENGEVKIGMTKTSHSTNWHVIQLKGVTAKVLASDALAAAVAAAEAAQSDVLPSSVAQELSSLIDANKNATYGTADEYIEAITALEEATTKAQTCNLAADKLAAMKQLIDATNVYTEEAYNEYYGKWAEAYENGTITFDEANALQDPFVITDWHASITVDNFLLSAWDTLPDAFSGYYINSWSTEGENDGTDFKVPFFEYWTGDDNSLGEKTLTATMSGLTPGWYEVSAWVRVRAKNGTGAADATGITLVANDGEPVDVTEGETNGQFNLAEYKAVGEVAEDGVLKIQFVVAADNNISWLSFQNVMFVETEKPADPVVLNAPTFNAAEGTQAEPTIIPEGTTLKINFTADNLEDNHLTADDLKVKIAVLITGDLPESIMDMQSETKHSVSGETFEIPLGETDFPVALKEGYVYQNIVVLSAQLVKGEEVIATYDGAPAQLHWIQVPAATDPEAAYEAALAAIEDGKDYRIFTEVNGEKYYVTVDGNLTNAVADGGIFTFTKVTGGALYNTGIQISSGSKRFTNPPLANDVANLTSGVFATSTNNRVDWETQVLFKNAYDQYAIRSCNTQPATSSWGDAGRTFWTWAVEEAVTPQYTYDQVYLWQIEGPITTINVTYQLYESDGTTKVSAVTKKQEANSEISIPADMTTVLAYDYTTEGTIGEEDCTIKVIRTFKEGVVHSLDDLSNEKAYTIRCVRGALLTKDDHLASTAHSSLTSAEAADFAIISYEDNYYLYSIADSKFVTFDPTLSPEGARAPLAEILAHGVEDAIVLQPQTDPFFLASFTAGGTNYGLNTNSNDPYGYVVNTWMTADDGNQYYIIEAGEFDPTEALAALEAYFYPSFTVTYVIKDADGNELFTSEPQPARSGDHITELPEALKRVFTEYSAIDVTVTEAETTIEVTATWNGPIALAKDFASITWQNIYIDRGTDNHWYLGNNDPAPLFAQNPDDEALSSDAYQWGFVGDPYNGLKMYNKSTGEAQTLTNGDAVAMADGEFVWDVLAKNGEGILIGVSAGYLNQSGGATATKLALWGSATDQGSTFFVSEVPANPNELELTIDVERQPGLGYIATTFVPDFTEALEFLGIEDITEATTWVINADDTEVEATFGDGTPDGWFDGQGTLVGWGTESTKICVKFNIADADYMVCDMNSADVVGTTYTVKYALKANGKAVIFTINVTFVEAPAPELEVLKTIEVGSVEYASSDASYIEKSLTLSDEQVADILSTLGLESLEAATVYGWNPTTETAIENYAGYDGWRDINGDFHSWAGTEDVPACVKFGAVIDGVDAKTFLTYNIQGSFSGDIKTYWAVANADNQAVLLEIIFTVTASDVQKALEEEIANAEALIAETQNEESYNQDDERLIEAVNTLNAAIQAAKDKLGTTDDEMATATDTLKDAEEAFKSALTGINGVNAMQNATIYDLSGRKLQKVQRGGIYIINGKKVAVK